MLGTTQTSYPPTQRQWSAYQLAWDFFNERLFGGELQPCILNFSRLARSHGFFAPKRWTMRWVGNSNDLPEISLNPDTTNRPPEEVLATLVHEMCHQWQFQCGKPSRGNYHNKEWAAKMKQVGLMPSSTAQPGGKETGQSVSHYILPDGAFARAIQDIPAECLLPWVGTPPEFKSPSPVSKVKFSCPGCGVNAWGKPGLNLLCGECNGRMTGPDVEDKLPRSVVMLSSACISRHPNRKDRTLRIIPHSLHRCTEVRHKAGSQLGAFLPNRGVWELSQGVTAGFGGGVRRWGAVWPRGGALGREAGWGASSTALLR